VEIGAVVGIRNAVSGPVGGQHRVDRTDARDEQLAEGRGVVEALLVEQRLVVSGRERETALLVDVQDARRRLLLEPLADVALVQRCRLGQLLGGRRAAVGEGAVEPEAHTEVDGQDVQRAQRRAEEPLDEGVAPLGRLDGHSRCRSGPSGACPSSRRRSTSTR
jgi:hypothetical protein